MPTRRLVLFLALASLLPSARAADKPALRAATPTFRIDAPRKKTEAIEISASFYDMEPDYFGPGRKPERISLQDAISQAINNNLEIKFDRVSVEMEQARKEFAFGVFDPVFSIQAGRDWVHHPDSSSNLTTVDAVNQLNAQQVQVDAINTNTLAVQQNVHASEQTARAIEQANHQPLTPFTTFNTPPLTLLDQHTTIVFDQQTDRFQAGLQERTPWGMRIALTAQQTKLRSTFIGDTRNIVPQYSSFGGIEIRQPLLQGFGPSANLADVRIARVNKRVAELQWRKRVADTVQAVMSVYYEMIYALKDVKVKEDAIAADKRLVDQNQRRMDLGFASPIDVQQARVAVSTDEEALLTAKSFFMERQYTLKRYLSKGFKTDNASVLIPTATPQLAVPVLDRSWCMRTAYENRFDYRAAITEAEIQNIRLKLAKNQALPQFDLVGSYGYNGLGASYADSHSAAINSQAPQWSIGFQFSVPLGNVQGRSQLKLVRELQDQASIKIKQAELTVSVDVDTVISRIETNRQRVETARQSRLLAEEAVHIGNRRLEEGQISSFDVIETRRKLYDAQSRELSALAELEKSVTLMWLATGTVLDRTGIVIKDPDPKKDR